MTRSVAAEGAGGVNRLVAELLRYGLSGAVVTAANLGLGLVLSGPAGFPIQVAIPIGYVVASRLHYTLQRTFVFSGVTFALSARRQAALYVPLLVAQYAFTAACTGLLPSPFGVSERAVFVVAALFAALMTFIALRIAVFRPRQTRSAGVRG